jgi:selenoprotein W-related protein
MAEVLIRYCLPCRYQPKALQDADGILKEFGSELSGLRLVPGDHGVYDVEVDGQLVFSMDQAMRFPETPELIATIRKQIGARTSRKKA